MYSRRAGYRPVGYSRRTGCRQNGNEPLSVSIPFPAFYFECIGGRNIGVHAGVVLFLQPRCLLHNTISKCACVLVTVHVPIIYKLQVKPALDFEYLACKTNLDLELLACNHTN